MDGLGAREGTIRGAPAAQDPDPDRQGEEAPGCCAERKRRRRRASRPASVGCGSPSLLGSAGGGADTRGGRGRESEGRRVSEAVGLLGPKRRGACAHVCVAPGSVGVRSSVGATDSAGAWRRVGSAAVWESGLGEKK